MNRIIELSDDEILSIKYVIDVHMEFDVTSDSPMGMYDILVNLMERLKVES